MELERRRGGEMSETHVHLEMNSDFFFLILLAKK